MTEQNKHHKTPENQPELPDDRLFELSPGERVRLNIDMPLLARDQVKENTGMNGSMVAIVNAGEESFMIIDYRGNDGYDDFFVMNDEFYDDPSRGAIGLSNQSNKVTVGSNYHDDIFKYEHNIAPRHFEVRYLDGDIIVAALDKKDGITIQARQAELLDPNDSLVDFEDNRTEAIFKRSKFRLRRSREREKDSSPHGYYKGRPVVGRDLDHFEGAVSMGGGSREAIYVDDTEGNLVKHAYEQLRHDVNDFEGMDEAQILTIIKDYTALLMLPNEKKTTRITQQYYGDKLMPLSLMIRNRTGVCRHHALFVAYTIEKLIDDEILDGKIRVERNKIPNQGVHTWAAFYPSDARDGEDKIIVDATQNFVGTVAEAEADRHWNYRLSTD
ncbi:hypothetical protein B7Y94_04235 [Candidatus Saccharibacteria bacterium 32-49-12]|nr:MAG: hypothetical protein B7Y94_04235 [Candidatus Saccharibacteria bacterium 32-49-12]